MFWKIVVFKIDIIIKNDLQKIPTSICFQGNAHTDKSDGEQPSF